MQALLQANTAMAAHLPALPAGKEEGDFLLSHCCLVMQLISNVTVEGCGNFLHSKRPLSAK